MATKVLITAFGESKSVYAWARDPRCVVSVNTLKARLADGWTLEAALSTPPRRRGQTPSLTPDETAALKAAADRVRALPRVHRNTPADAPERAATRVRNQLMRQAAAHASIAEIARAVGLSHEQARYHLRGTPLRFLK